MHRNPQDVRETLRRQILAGYRPHRDSESAEDHGADWFALTSAEFEEIERSALEELEKRAACPQSHD